MKTLSFKIIFATILFFSLPFSNIYAESNTTNTNTQINSQFQNTAADQLRGSFTGGTGNGTVDTTGAPRAVIVDQSGNTYLPASIQNSQALGYTGSGQYGLDGNSAAASFGQCITSGALANAVKGQIEKLIGGAVDTRVPTGNAALEGKESGTVAGVSWDQLGWCTINSVIEAVGDATVNWINTGFQGNPVFVDNPEQFFGDVADMQAGIFLNELSNGLLCTPIQNWVRISLASNYNNGITFAPSCSFTGISGNLEQFMSGETFSWTDWMSYTQNPYNNPFGATLGTKIELDQRIASALNTQSTILDWGAGFLSKVDPETKKITSPGSVIEKQVNERLFSGQKRLEIADEFDEVVNALVTQLVRVAITEMTDSNSQY